MKTEFALVILLMSSVCFPALAEQGAGQVEDVAEKSSEKKDSAATSSGSPPGALETDQQAAGPGKPSGGGSEKDPREQMSGILYGEGHVYKLTAPKGWILDNRVAADTGLHAVFYPIGGSWADSPAVMYTRVQERRGRSMQEMIEADLKHMGQDSVSFKSTTEPAIETRDGKTSAAVRYLSGDKFNSFEAVAYFEEPKLIALVILSARNKDAFEKALPAFNDLARSYSWITDKLKIEDMTTK